ncbi:hypothetical protein HPB51_021475 [Rhipicephalus microplus]|uniref:THAP-type domain-containing protein n=1 Tax=Rhipicephalus microplus TaxID=6941 RepID=A0A9J6DJ56_RHIMP|nr:hypothetical protein HPB51_021475 [Rhipicephalus microplus]
MAERRRDKRDRTCFVPYCNSGYRSCKEARSLFRVPADIVKREAWSRLIKRADRELNDASAVCDLHFEAHFIERTFKTTINGEVVEIECDRPQLAKDALPTIFLGASTYISKWLPKKEETAKHLRPGASCGQAKQKEVFGKLATAHRGSRNAGFKHRFSGGEWLLVIFGPENASRLVGNSPA